MATVGTGIASASEATTSSPVAATPSPSSASSSRQRSGTPSRKVGDAAGELTRKSAFFAKALVEISSSDVDAATYERSLATVDLEDTSNALSSIDPSERSQEAISALLRSVERLRRVVVKSLDIPTLESSSILWLQSFTVFTERVFSNIEDAGDCVRDCMPGLIDTALALMKRNTTPEFTALSLDQLDTIHASFATHSSHVELTTRAHYANCLIQSAYSLALRFSRSDALPAAIDLCRRSCEWSQSFLDRNSDADETIRKSIAAPLAKRWELLGYCLQKGSFKTVSTTGDDDV